MDRNKADGPARERDPENYEIKITPEMMLAGTSAYMHWNSDLEEPEALVAEIFYSMMDMKMALSRGEQFPFYRLL